MLWRRQRENGRYHSTQAGGLVAVSMARHRHAGTFYDWGRVCMYVNHIDLARLCCQIRDRFDFRRFGEWQRRFFIGLFITIIDISMFT